jgi:hypothetical protein
MLSCRMSFVMDSEAHRHPFKKELCLLERGIDAIGTKGTPPPGPNCPGPSAKDLPRSRTSSPTTSVLSNLLRYLYLLKSTTKCDREPRCAKA